MDEPLEVAEARERLQEQSRFRALIVLIAFGGAFTSAGLDSTGAEDLTVMLAVMGTLLAALAVSGMYLPQAERWKQAQRVLSGWKERAPAAKEEVGVDPRLATARTLIARIIALGAEVEGVDRVTTAVEARLQARLTDLIVLEASAEAHPSPTVVEARARSRAEVDATLDALRELHAALSTRTEPDGLAELLGRLAADAEVSAVQPSQARHSGLSRPKNTVTTF